jgi:hypothetical protein
MSRCTTGINDIDGNSGKFATCTAGLVDTVENATRNNVGIKSDCLHLKVNLKKKKYPRVYVNCPTQRCQKNIYNFFN